MNRTKVFIAFTFLLAFAVCVAAQKSGTSKKLDNLDLINMNNQAANLEPGFVTPNELEGYEFFKKGKLNKLRLGVSNKADVKKIFGGDCENPCDYDSNWTVQFDYFDENFVLITEKKDKNQNPIIERQQIPKKEVIGKILSVTFKPKKIVSFSKVAFSDEFRKFPYLETGYLTPGKKDVLGISFDYYMDSYGLQYLIFDKIVNPSLKDTFSLKDSFVDFQKGNLILIKYMIPKELESRFFVEVR